jgi:hypothetical protein
MVGALVLNQTGVREAVDSDIGNASLGLTAHAEDSHNNQRFACPSNTAKPCYGDGPRSPTNLPGSGGGGGGRGGNGSGGAFAWNEGDFHSVEGGHIYQLPAFLALPKADQASNLLVSSAPSASHIAFSTFRMEPAFMVMGHSVGTWVGLFFLLSGLVSVASPSFFFFFFFSCFVFFSFVFFFFSFFNRYFRLKSRVFGGDGLVYRSLVGLDWFTAHCPLRVHAWEGTEGCSQ